MSWVFPGCNREVGKGCRIYCSEHSAELKKNKGLFEAHKAVLSAKPSVLKSANMYGFKRTSSEIAGRSKLRQQIVEREMYDARMRGEI